MIGYRRIGRMVVFGFGLGRFVKIGERWALTVLGVTVGAVNP